MTDFVFNPGGTSSGGSSNTSISSSYAQSSSFATFAAKGTYDIGVFWGGKPSAGEKLMKFVAVRPYTLNANLPQSQFAIGTTPTATMSFNIFKNATLLGSMSFNPVGSPILVFTASIAFGNGDILEVDAPSVQDSTGADISFSLVTILN